MFHVEHYGGFAERQSPNWAGLKPSPTLALVHISKNKYQYDKHEL